MREQTRSYTTTLPCIGLKFLASIRRSLEHAAPGTRLHADTDSGRFYIIRQAYDYAITTGSRTQPLRLTSTRAGYGVRYWYLCPHCAKRCAKLYIGLQDAGCRQCWSLHYASQSENAENRMMRAIRRKRLALWGASEPYHELMNLGMSPGMFFKPKGMHWKTSERKQARRSSPPTLLRWVWESAIATQCKMVLLLNLDTLGKAHDEIAQQAISEILCDAWLTVTGADRNGVTNITPIIVNRSGRGTFTAPFNQLRSQVQVMVAPVTTARTGVTTIQEQHGPISDA